MADITMCGNKTCSKREDCYRFTAPPNEWIQSYFYPDPTPTLHIGALGEEVVACAHFLLNDKTRT